MRPPHERHLDEVERALLYISEARERAEKARKALIKDNAPTHLITALEETERAMKAEHRRLMQKTFWAVTEQDKLAV